MRLCRDMCCVINHGNAGMSLARVIWQCAKYKYQRNHDSRKYCHWRESLDSVPKIIASRIMTVQITLDHAPPPPNIRSTIFRD
jgi:uncharacterized protein YcgL (UPF0745 family)